jgi:hypothetical protein
MGLLWGAVTEKGEESLPPGTVRGEKELLL